MELNVPSVLYIRKPNHRDVQRPRLSLNCRAGIHGQVCWTPLGTTAFVSSSNKQTTAGLQAGRFLSVSLALCPSHYPLHLPLSHPPPPSKAHHPPCWSLACLGRCGQGVCFSWEISDRRGLTDTALFESSSSSTVCQLEKDPSFN